MSRLNILHVVGPQSGVAADTVVALKNWSGHRHELVAVAGDPLQYTQPALTTATTSPPMLEEFVTQADVIHFHGSVPQIHGCTFLCKKTVLHVRGSLLLPDGSWGLSKGDDAQGLEGFTRLAGAYPSCALSYGRPDMRYLPDILPISDWLYRPYRQEKPRRVCSYNHRRRVKELAAVGIDFELLRPYWQESLTLEYVRRAFAAAVDNYSFGHWTRFGLACLAQGVPCVCYIHPDNYDAFKREVPPFIPTEYGGTGLVEVLQRTLALPAGELSSLANYGRFWMKEHYDPEKLVWQWDEFYAELGD